MTSEIRVGAWVSSPPPTTKVVLARFGSSIVFVAYALALDKWFAVGPGNSEQAIDVPPLWFDREAPSDTAAEETQSSLEHVLRAPTLRQPKGARQLSWSFAAPDFNLMSGRAGGQIKKAGVPA